MPEHHLSDQAGQFTTTENLNPFEIAMQQFDLAVGVVAEATRVRGIFP